MVQIEIDGKSYTVEQGAMIIEVADELGIAIPRFCYHKKLSIAANCRMCLVQVENAPKPLPACATPVSDGMKILTKSQKAIEAQQAVMEFLLINHPLDCPICDQGGQCELQDIALGYGLSYSEYHEGKRAVDDKDIGPLISTEMTRCIHCTRCVRFGDEIAGQRELGATNRGENTQIGTYLEHSMSNELSGNAVDLCPVGALTSKPFRFKARSWEMMARSSISSHDCVGSNIYYHTLRDNILRAVPKENESINEIWLSDRDRYSYEGLSQNRLTDPLVKKNGVWEKVDWQEALTLATENIQNVLEKSGAEQIGALSSPNITLEEGYLLQKLLRGMDIFNIDHRLKRVNFNHQKELSVPQLGVKYAALEEANSILLIGCDIRMETPLLAVRMRKAIKLGTQVFTVNPQAFEFNFPVTESLLATQGDFVTPLLELIKAIQPLSKVNVNLSSVVSSALQNVTVSESAKQLAEQFVQGEKKHLILGAFAAQSPDADWVYHLARVISELTGATFGELSEGANSAGCWLSGVLPHQGAFFQSSTQGKHTQDMLAHPLSAYILVNVDPDYDFSDSPLAKKALEQAQFVLAFSAFDTPGIRESADIIFPMTPQTETKGTYVNAQGDWQRFEVVAKPQGNSKPLWKILRVLGNFLHVDDMGYEQLDEVTHEINEKFENAAHKSESLLSHSLGSIQHQMDTSSLVRLAPTPIYATDALVRNAVSLQQTPLAKTNKLWIHPDTAQSLGLHEADKVVVEQDGRQSEVLTVVLEPLLSQSTVMVPSGIPATKNLGAGFSRINIHNSKGGE